MAGTQSTQTHTTISFICENIMSGSIGAASAWAFTTINPIAGAIFGVTSTWGTHIVEFLNETMKCTADSTVGKVAGFTIQALGGIGLGVLATTLAGYPLTFTAGVILTAATIVTALAVAMIGTVCVVTGAVALKSSS
jgi:hypothetical protein